MSAKANRNGDSAPRPVFRPVFRKEAWEKVTGRALYVDDLAFPGMLHGATVRSPLPRGKILAIRYGGDIPWHEFTIVTAKDIPGSNHVALLQNDQPFLADGVVNHAEEPVVLLAHPDPHLVQKARGQVQIEVEPLDAVLSIDASLAAKAVVWGKDNVFKSFLVEKGSVDSAWASAHLVVEGEYATGAQEQLYIETNGVLAVASAESGVTVWGSLQCPYYVQRALMPLFAMPPERVRVIQAETGGGFGGKEEYPSLISGHAALLAWKSGRPVKIIYDRAEDMLATTKRHPSRTRHRTAVSKDGKLLAMEIDFVLDGGAYMTLSPVVLSRGTIHAAGPYLCPNVRIRSRAVATNTPPQGAFRGFGAPQSLFALERHMDRVAKALGLSPEEFRGRNFLSEGDTTATRQTLREPMNLPGLLEQALTHAGYAEKRKRFPMENARSPIRRGIGFATFLHGAGFTGSGERYLASVAGVEATSEGRVRVLAANTEIGQGARTVLAQIAAEALGLPYDSVEVAQPDTAVVPNSGPTVASRTTMVVGKLVETASHGLRQMLIHAGLLTDKFTPDDFRLACAEYVRRFGPLKSYSQYRQPKDVWWDDENYRGDAYATFAWAVYVAEVAVDTRTCEVRVEDFVALQEVGRVVNPVLAAGQIEGGVAQGIGWALSEEVVWKDGRMANPQMTNYIIPTSADAPPIRVFFNEVPSPHGPGGAKGIGELPLDGPAPAVLNAISDALGADFREIPLTPERIFSVLWKGGETG